jgi:hypothetical protein
MLRVKLVALICFLIIISAPFSPAQTVKGVDFKDSITEGEGELLLQGVGVRTKFIFSVYAGALYLTTPTSKASEAIEPDEPKRIEMVFLRDVDNANIKAAYKEGFENNTPESSADLKERINTFLALFTGEALEGDRFIFSYIPEKGTNIKINDAILANIKGADFMRALFRIWLGENPADKELKQQMLG